MCELIWMFAQLVAPLSSVMVFTVRGRVLHFLGLDLRISGKICSPSYSNAGSTNTGPRPGAVPWSNCYRAVRNQGQIGPEVTETTDIWNTLQIPLTTIILTGRSILLRQSKPRSLTESVPWRLTSCNKFACAKYSLLYWGSVRTIVPSWNRSAAR